MPFSLSPSVTITEKDLSTIIPRIATTQAAFCGRFDDGPVDQIIDIGSEQELYETFGSPAAGERGVDWFACANFLNYGDRLKVVRVDEGNTTHYSAIAGGLTAANLHTGQIMVAGNGSNATAVGGQSAYHKLGANVRVKNPGIRGNSLRVIFFPAGNDPFDYNLQHGASGAPAGGGVGIGIHRYGDVVGDYFAYVPTSTASVYNSNVSGILTGGVTQDEVHFAVIDEKGIYNTIGGLAGPTGDVLEKFEDLSMWKGVYDSTGRNLYYKDYINANSNYISIEENTHRSIFMQKPFANTGGATGGDPTWTPTTTAMPFPIGQTFGRAQAWNAILASGAQSGTTHSYDGQGSNRDMTLASNPHLSAIKAAWRKHFRDPDTIDIDILLGGAAEQTLSKELIDICEFRKDCVAFISPPHSPAGTEYSDIVNSSNLTGYSGPSDVIKYRNTQGFNSSYAVMDSGWKYMYDSYNDNFRWMPLNPDIAGLVARTEQGEGPWFSPAGMNRGRIQGVVKLAMNPTKTERDRLYTAGINPVVSFPGEGAMLFGDKTLQRRASALDRINVRRLMIHLEKSIATAARFQLFEFNDGFTRRSFISTILPFLRRVQAQRGITDFRVVCDETNNTGAVISANEFVADIFIKPAYSINFIQLNFSVLRADATFNESVV